MIAWLTRGSWKTTSTGLLAIIGGIVRLIFAVKAGNLSEEAVMTILTTIITGVGLLAARDNGVSSEQVGADPASKAIKEFAKGESQSSDGGNLGKLPLWLLCGFLSLGLLTPALTGCGTLGSKPTPQAVAFLTLAQTKSLVDNAEKVYGNQVVLGHVSKAKQSEIDAKIVTFHQRFGLAVKIAKSNYSASTPADVQSLADQLVTAINTLSK